ncbi:MAG: ribonuclease HI family protein [bacterium]
MISDSARLQYAIRLLAAGQNLDRVWREAGYPSRRALADDLQDLAESLEAGAPAGAHHAKTASGGGKRAGARPDTGRKPVVAGGSGPARVIAYSDGGSSGNPGPAGCGAVILDQSGEVLLEDHKYLGETTNNVAEYQGAILALTRASEIGARCIELRVDSGLLANQIKGGYRVKNAGLVSLYRKLVDIIRGFDSVEIKQITSAENRQADRLAKLAIASGRR